MACFIVSCHVISRLQYSVIVCTYFKVIIDGFIEPFLSSGNASELDPFDKSAFACPDDDELGLSAVLKDLRVLLSSLVAIASQIKGDSSEKFASNSFMDPSCRCNNSWRQIFIMAAHESSSTS